MRQSFSFTESSGCAVGVGWAGAAPVLDWSVFNGMRTLSANIAVELPEAPMGGTLFRVLFLAALLLFVLTFVVNTVAELVRLHLRRKYRYL